MSPKNQNPYNRFHRLAETRFAAMLRAFSTSMLLVAVVLSSPSCAFAVEPDSSVAGQHDMFLILPDGPVHLRIVISDGGQSLGQKRVVYLQELTEKLDVDQDGRVSRTETTKHPLFVSGRRFSNNKFLNRLKRANPLTNDELAMAVDRAAGQLVTYRQNKALADQDLSVFQVLDTDGSGLLERYEMRLAASSIAARDSDFDQCVTFDEFIDEPVTNNMFGQVSIVNDEPPSSLHSELLRDANEPVMAARLVREYDSDRDAHLNADELQWEAVRVEKLDSNGDARLSMSELRFAAKAEPDVQLRLDLNEDATMAMQAVNPSKELTVQRSDVVTFRRGTLSLNIGYRHRDPMQEARQSASATFNSIDVDQNGYLDREEVQEHQRFARYLFDAMDADEDDRVFAEELLDFVSEYTRPTSTTCQLTLLDTGNGFFQMLDQNSDGRVSIRELRGCEESLLTSADDSKVINPSQLPKTYRIEIQRGGIGLFGRVDRPTAETPATLLKPPSGPIWFQRMDRNADGDLTWDEFLGPRDAFHQIDSDQDGLIDEPEARKVSNNL